MFGFTYEDSKVEKYAIQKYFDNNLNNKVGIMILSGGDTMFDIAPYFEELIAIDSNVNQVNLVNNKIQCMNSNQYKTLLDSLNTPFDELFIGIKNGKSFEEVFSNDNLISKFGENAVTNTTECFSEHFKKVYDVKKQSNDNFFNWIFERDMDSKNKQFDIDKIKQVDIINGNIIDLLQENMYNFIQVSNIGDWMCKSDFINLCKILKNSLKKNGICIVRRLLSDNHLEPQFENCEVINDNTQFYKETIIWQKVD